MAEAALHPRPSFYSFLQADSFKSGDALTYYDYQRAIRAKKVEILQQKKASSYEPGYKKPGVPHPASRRVFQLKSKYPIFAPCTVTVDPASLIKTDTAIAKEASIETININEPTINRSASLECVNSAVGSTTSLDGLEATGSKSSLKQASSRPSSAKVERDKENMTEAPTPATAAALAEGQPLPQAQTERMARIVKRPRLVKSATAREQKSVQASSVGGIRPNTVAGTRESGVQTDGQDRLEGLRLDGKALVASTPHQRAYSEGLLQVKQENGLTDQDRLSRSYQWGTATQRSYDEVPWAERVPIPRHCLPTSTVEQFPDAVSQRLTFRRYHSEPAGWQNYGPEWDYAQSRRCDTFIKGPQAVAFCSSSKKVQQIPGYTGYLPGLGVYDEGVNVNYTPINLVRTNKPRKTSISRRANIPGYTGQVHWTSTSPAHSNSPVPELSTSARAHRAIPLEDEFSPFKRDGVLSKMVTTVSPYNPFNKIQY